MAFAAFADARSTSRWSRSASAAPGTPPTSPTRRSPSSRRSGWTTPRFLGSTIEQIAGEKAGIIKPGSYGVLAQQPVEAAEVLLRRSVEVDALVAREGLEFGVASAHVAVGGQLLYAARSGRGVRRPVPAAARRPPGAQRRLRARRGRGVPRRRARRARPLDLDLVRAAFAGGDLAGAARGRSAARPPCVLDAAHNPAGARATAEALARSLGFTRLVGVVAAMADKDVARHARGVRAGAGRGRGHPGVVHRSMPADELAAVAVEVFGDDRVEVGAAAGRRPRRRDRAGRGGGRPRRGRRPGHRLDRHRGARPAPCSARSRGVPGAP